MPHRRRVESPPPEPIQRGDIVEFSGHSWDVLARTILDETTTPPAVQLRLTRRELVKAPTPYGRPQRYMTVPVFRQADARRCRLVAHQEPLL